jgi:hypothetical protein
LADNPAIARHLVRIQVNSMTAEVASLYSFCCYSSLRLRDTDVDLRRETCVLVTKKILTLPFCQRFRGSKKGFFSFFTESSRGDDEIRQKVVFFVEKAGRDVQHFGKTLASLYAGRVFALFVLVHASTG